MLFLFSVYRFISRSGFEIFKMAKYRPVVISGPSGVGKSTILKMLFNDYPECFAFSVSRKFSQFALAIVRNLLAPETWTDQQFAKFNKVKLSPPLNNTWWPQTSSRVQLEM